MQFRVSHVFYVVLCVAILSGWLADHVRLKYEVKRAEFLQRELRGKLDDLIYEFEFHTDKTIEEDEYAMWMVDAGNGGRQPIAGMDMQVDGASPLGQALTDAMNHDQPEPE